MGENGENGGHVIEIEVLPGESSERLDTYLASRIENVSRTYVKRLIEQGCVTLEAREIEPSHRVKEGEVFTIALPEPEPEEIEPEPMALNVIYSDEDIVVINKPAGLTVHPVPGQTRGTLVSGLLYHFKTLSAVQGEIRPGIVHRLDKDTSGVMVAARNDAAHRNLAAQFKEHSVTKLYLAIVHGRPRMAQGEIGRPIGRHLKQVGKMAIDGLDAKPAKTFYEAIDSVWKFSVVRCRILTGRTHQIRVHMSHIGCPVVCDAMYGREAVLTREDIGGPKGDETPLLSRQGLHAYRLTFQHPKSGVEMTFEAPVPPDMAGFLDYVKAIHG
jgi:23S rRNA pseudouridine1911/1915/1917 synthase